MRPLPFALALSVRFALLLGFALGLVTPAAYAQAPRLTLTSPNPEEDGFFGDAVAGVSDMDGDGRGDLLVGGESDRVYLFSGDSGDLLRTFTSPNPQPDNCFGNSLSGVSDADGDGQDDLLVGDACEPSSGVANVGRAYLFSGATGALLRTLSSPSPEQYGIFGNSVSGVEDADGDGRGDLLIGARQEDGGAQDAGRAYLFSGATGALLRTLTSPNPEFLGLFGKASGIPDADGDGRGDLLVGAYYEDGGALDAGRAYLFSGATGTLLRTLTSPSPEDFGWFGVSMSGVEDADGDGRGDLLVGAMREDFGTVFNAGRAYLYSGATGALLRTLSSLNPEPNGNFGQSVSGVADADGDGRGDLLIGAWGESVAGLLQAGRAYLLSGASGAYLQTLESPNPELGYPGNFSGSVSGVSGGGHVDLLVGAPSEDGGAEDAGRAYLFPTEAQPVVEVSFFNVPFGPLVNGGTPIAEGTLSDGPPAKICADGSEATRIVLKRDGLTSNNIGDLLVELVGDVPPGEEEAYLGSLSLPVYDPEEDAAVLLYTHPRLVNSAEISYRINLQVQFEGETLGDYPIDVYRAPVLMIHGIWSNADDAFLKMENSLKGAQTDGEWPAAILHRMDYRGTNAAHFSTNFISVKDELRYLFARAVGGGYSAGKADVVVHSMGGILTRLYLQEPWYSTQIEKINRFITINTPHSGSHGADLIMSAPLIRLLLDLSGHPTGYGAVEDLRVESPAIDSTLNGASLNRNRVPSHALGTLHEGAVDGYGWELILIPVASKLFDLTEDAVLKQLYHEPSDLVVAQSSQQGGLTGSSTTLIQPQIHSGASSNAAVIDAVRVLLNTDPLSPSFTLSGFDPPDLSYIPLLNVGPTASSGVLAVTITSPATSTVVAPGQTVSVSAVGEGGVSELIVAAGNPNIPAFSDTYDGTSTTFEYVVPEEAVGPVTIAVAGLNDTEYAVDSVLVIVEPTAALDSLTAYPSYVIVSATDTTGLLLTGHYADGIGRDVTGLPGITYSAADPTIATVTEAGQVAGVSEGTTSVSASYGGQAVEVEVLVIPAPAPVGVEPFPDDEVPTSTALLPAYPNPSDRTVTIPFRLPSRQRVALRVYDLLGREVRLLLDSEVDAGLHEVRLDAQGLASGIYLVRMDAENYREARTITLFR